MHQTIKNLENTPLGYRVQRIGIVDGAFGAWSLIVSIRQYKSVAIVWYLSCDGRVYASSPAFEHRGCQMPNFGPHASWVGN
jgi:hypothetical protein